MLTRRVLPGLALVRATVCPTSALIRLDLPTLERPTRAISGAPSAGRSRGPAALLMNSVAAAVKLRANLIGRRPRGRQSRSRSAVPARRASDAQPSVGSRIVGDRVFDLGRSALAFGWNAGRQGLGQGDL